MTNVFRSIAITICSWIYPLIPPLYGVFYDLANGQFFTETTINTLSNNLYVLVSVVMLFTFAVTLIKSIVNPDMLTDNKKGTTGFIKRAGLSLVIIVIIPLAFDQMYNIQGQILQNNLIEKIVVGYSGDSSTGSIAKKSNAGQVLAASVLVDLLYPKEGANTGTSTLETDYNNMITTNIDDISKVADSINEKYSPSGDEDASDDEKEYVFEFQALVSIIAGGFILYMLVLFCLDMGVRLIKLGLLEITAPVSVIAYIYNGTESLQRWVKEVFSTYLQVFVKIAALSIVIFALQNVDTFMQGLDTDHPWLVRVFIVIGLLTLAHQLPDLVSSLFGMSYKGKGGIKGRLSNMAAVGGIAAAAWDKARGKVAGAATLGATALGGAAAATAGAVGKGLDNKLLGGRVQGTAEKLKNSVTSKANGLANTSFGQNAARIGRAATAGIKAGGVTGTLKAFNDSYKDDKVTKYREAEKLNAKDAKFMNALGVDADTKSLTGTSTSSTKARDAYSNMIDSVNNNNILNKVQRKKLSDKISADLKKSNIDKLKTNHSNVKDNLKSLASEASANGNPNVSDKLTTLMNNFNDGKISTTGLASEISKLALNGSINETSANNIVSSLNKINHLASNDADIASIVKNGSVSGTSIAIAASNAENVAAAADSALKAELDISNDVIKHEIENYTTASEIINSKYTAEINKQGTNMNLVQGPIAPSNNSETSSTQQNSNIQSNNGKLDSSIPSGYIKTDSGIIIPNNNNDKK